MSMEDQAQALELRQWEQLNKSRTSGQIKFSPADAGYGPEECDECGAAMPAPRREWGFSVCVTCQQQLETQQKHYRR